jgi:hypothetical protein
MPYNKLSTSKIAKAVGCHPNTVRLYEQWGLIQPVPRSAKGLSLIYRSPFGPDAPGAHDFEWGLAWKTNP